MRKLFRNQRGDTIAEVMICIAIISLMLAAAFALTNQNQTNARQAQERSEATRIADKHLELLKAYADLYQIDGATPLPAHFCMKYNAAAAAIDPLRAVEVVPTATPNSDPNSDNLSAYNADCKDQNNLFSSAIWAPDGSAGVGADITNGKKTFAVVTRWASLDNGRTEEVKIFYTVYNSSTTDFATGPRGGGAIPVEICANGRDDDGDGAVDENPPCPPPPVEICGNGADDDGDGAIDESPPCPALPPFILIQGSQYTSCRTTEPTVPATFGCQGTSDGTQDTWNCWNYEPTYTVPALTAGTKRITINYLNHACNATPPPSTSIYRYTVDVYVNGVRRIADWNLNSPAGSATRTLGIVPANAQVRIHWKNNMWIPSGCGSGPCDPNFRIDSIRIGP